MGLLVIAVNALAIFIVGGVGDALRSRVSLRDRRILLQVCGTLAFVLGTGGLVATMVDTAAKQAEIKGTILAVVALAIGWGLGRAFCFENLLLYIGRGFVCFFDRDKKKHRRVAPSVSASSDSTDGLLVKESDRFGYGFVLMTVLVCSGPFFMDAVTGNGGMAFVQVGVNAVLALALGLTYGGGVSMAALSMVVIQGLLALVCLFGGEARITPEFIGQLRMISTLLMAFAGGIMISGKRMRVSDLLLAYPVAVLYQMVVALVP